MFPMTEFVPVDGRATDDRVRARFDAWVQVYAQCASAVLDGDADERTPDDFRELERDPTRERLGIAAVDGDVVVGALAVILPLRDNVTVAVVRVAVLPEYRGQGLGSALLARGEALARSRGRRIVQGHSVALPRVTDPATAFLERREYGVAQRMLRSDLRLDHDVDARPVPQEYRLEHAVGRIPTAWHPAYAEFQRAMSTDAPLGDLVLEEEEWDAARVAELDARDAAMGRDNVLVVARRVDDDSTTGFAGFTQVQWARAMGERAYQQDTLVRRGDRGHGLGLALKAAALDTVRHTWPQVASIRTWNAHDNTYMLAVNHTLGYVATGVMTEWQKRLAS